MNIYVDVYIHSYVDCIYVCVYCILHVVFCVWRVVFCVFCVLCFFECVSRVLPLCFVCFAWCVFVSVLINSFICLFFSYI